MHLSRNASRCLRLACARGHTAAPLRARGRGIKPGTRVRLGFTMAELVVVSAIVVILTLLVLPIVSRARDASRSVSCISNLRQVALAFRLYAQDHSGVLPDPAMTQDPWERSLNRYIEADTFRCPSDRELAPATGSSYDWRDTGQALTSLAGRTLAEPLRDHAVFVFEGLPSWHEKDRMNVAYTDGSAETLESAICVDDLEWPIFGEAAYDYSRSAAASRRKSGGR